MVPAILDGEFWPTDKLVAIDALTKLSPDHAIPASREPFVNFARRGRDSHQPTVGARIFQPGAGTCGHPTKRW